MTALERIEPQETAIAPANESAAILQVIERAAMNPNVDIDKMERLLQMQERIMERNSKAAFTSALADMQPLLPVIDRRGKIVVKDKNDDTKIRQSTPYALWEDINEEIRPHMAAHGFALSFRVGETETGKITVTAVLSHRAGHSEETTMTLTHDSTGSKNNVQAIGSSVSYGKRYTALALLNITTRGEDDDAASVNAITDAQREQLAELIDRTGTDIAKFCAHFKVDALADLPMTKFGGALAALQKKDAANA